MDIGLVSGIVDLNTAINNIKGTVLVSGPVSILNHLLLTAVLSPTINLQYPHSMFFEDGYDSYEYLNELDAIIKKNEKTIIVTKSLEVIKAFNILQYSYPDTNTGHVEIYHNDKVNSNMYAVRNKEDLTYALITGLDIRGMSGKNIDELFNDMIKDKVIIKN